MVMEVGSGSFGFAGPMWWQIVRHRRNGFGDPMTIGGIVGGSTSGGPTGMLIVIPGPSVIPQRSSAAWSPV